MDPKNVVCECLSAITLIGSSAAELAQKHRNNVRKLCADEFQSLCGPAPGTPAAKKKPANKGSVWLLGDDLKAASKEAKRSADICKNSGESSGEYKKKQQDFRSRRKPNEKFRGDNRQNHYDGYTKDGFRGNNKDGFRRNNINISVPYMNLQTTFHPN